MINIIPKIREDFPDLYFRPGNLFMMIDMKGTAIIRYITPCKYSSQRQQIRFWNLILHEVGHYLALMRHRSTSEILAWKYAEFLCDRYNIEFDRELMNICLKSHKRNENIKIEVAILHGIYLKELESGVYHA